jgi:pilus assembly protein Flp/PilA
MTGVLPRVRHFLVGEDGPTAVEYAVMLALLILVCIAAVRGFGANLSGSFSSSLSTLGGL